MEQAKDQYITFNFESREANQQNQTISAEYFALLNLQETGRIETQLFELDKNSKASLIKYFKDHCNINYNPNQFEESISISILYHTPNYEAMKINVKYGFFSIQLSIVNVDANSPSDNIQIVSSGGFGDVYKTWAEQQQIVIKKIKFQEEQYAKTLRQAIKQYFLLIIASSLSCGPKIHKAFGFDIAIFRDSIEFSMEYCIKKAQANPSLHDLKKKLHLLHVLHIIHCDIKPDNIAYSRYYKSFVFLDFGISFIAKENIGQKIVTGFVGSVEFCTRQLWQLFMNNNLDAVDLYLNDAFALDKSISVFQSTHSEVQLSIPSQEHDENQMIFFDGKDPQKFYRSRSIIFIKNIFFNISLDNSFKESDLVNHHQYLDSDMSKIVEFTKMLPLNELLIHLFKKYCKYGEEDDIDRGIYKTCVRSIQDQNNGQDNFYSTFINRYNQISSIDSSRNGNQFINRVGERRQLINDNNFQVSKEDSAYIMTIVRLIKINGQTDNFNYKISACKDYLSKFGINFQQFTQRELYNKTMLQIFNRSLSNFQADRLIFKHTIQTVIILEIIFQDHLLQVYKFVLQSSLKFVEKMSFVLEFFAALQFINQKYKTNYNYEDLIQAMLIYLDDQLDVLFGSSEMTRVEQICFFRLKQLIVQRAGYARNIKNQSNLPLKQIFNKNQAITQQDILLSDLETYLFYLEGQFEFNCGNASAYCYHQYISNCLTSRDVSLNHFYYLHFYYFQKTLSKSEDYFNFLTYQLFEKQLGSFQQLTYFKIYYMKKVKSLNRNLLRSYMQLKVGKNKQKQEDVESNISSSNIESIQQLLKLFKIIIKETKQFHIYFSIFFEMLPKQNKYIVQLLKQFFIENIDKLVTFSRKYHKKGTFNHNIFLKVQIIVINNIIYIYKKLANIDLTHLIQNYFQEALQVINNSECLICKTICLLELKFIEAYFQNKRPLEERLMLLADISTIIFKHIQLWTEIQRVILNISKFVFENRQLRQKFCLRQFLYLITMKFKNPCFCLTYFRQFCIFTEVYFHILQSYSAVQLCQFILEILEQIKKRRSIDNITKFYYNSLNIIKLSRQDKQSCKEYYNQVLKHLLNHEESKENPYISLYLLALLQMNIKGIFQQKIIKVIKKTLSKVDNFTKQLLLCQYYKLYAFYFDSAQRKLGYLKRLHFKHTLTELSKQFIKRQKISRKSKKIQCPLNLNKLRHSIENYHKNLQNLKQKKDRKK